MQFPRVHLLSSQAMIETVRVLERQSSGMSANLPHLSDPSAMRVARKLAMFADVSPASALNFSPLLNSRLV